MTSDADLGNLDKRIASCRQVLVITRSFDFSVVPDSLASLADTIDRRYRRIWQRVDLDERVNLLREALTLVSATLSGDTSLDCPLTLSSKVDIPMEEAIPVKPSRAATHIGFQGGFCPRIPHARSCTHAWYRCEPAV